MECRIRPLRPEEREAVLGEMMYQALYHPEGGRYARDIVLIPALRKYFADFNGPHDRCLVAEAGGNVAEAVWTPLLTVKEAGYGYVDDETPELAIALLPEHRGRGIGTRLLREMIGVLRAAGYQKVSLSVHRTNPAAGLYRALGFEPVREAEEDDVMVLELG